MTMYVIISGPPENESLLLLEAIRAIESSKHGGLVLVDDQPPTLKFEKLHDEILNLEMPLVELPIRKDHRTRKEHRAAMRRKF